MAENVSSATAPELAQEKRHGPYKVTDWPPFIHAWHDLFFSWLSMVLVKAEWMRPETASWLCSIFLVITMTIIMTNFRPVWLLVTVLVLVLVLLVGKLLTLAGASWPAALWHSIKGIDPGFDVTDHMISTTILTILYFVMLAFQPFLNYWEFDHNEVRHVRGGRVDNTYTRQNYDFGSQYQDGLEFLSTLSAQFTIKEKGTGFVVASIDSLPFYPFRRKRIDNLLRTLSVVSEPERQTP
ncbi:MAG: hypothetical protein U1E76_04155 [Planctomycetota bacterium]